MRVNGESGIPEGSHRFWKTLFEAIAHAGRTTKIDMDGKSVNQTRSTLPAPPACCSLLRIGMRNQSAWPFTAFNGPYHSSRISPC
jgi:hypothetical protein